MATRRPDRAWIGGGVAASLVIVAAGWMLFISPQLDAKAEAEQQFADAQTQNIVLQQRLNTLREQSGQAPAFEAELAAAHAAIPPSHDIAGYTRELTAQADLAGVTLISVAPSAPVELVLPETEKAEPAASDTSTTGTADDGAADDSAAEDSAAGKIYTIEVSVITDGPLAGQRDFLSGLERDTDRRSLVTSAELSPAASDDDDEADAVSWTMTTSLQIFVAPQDPGDDEASDAAQNSN